MARLLALVDRLSALLSRLAQGVVLLLVLAMCYEVAARYIFGAPTLWAFDIAYMATGTLFILGAADALRADAHVRIDLLARRLPKGLRRWLDAGLFLGLLTPLFAALSWIALRRAWRAFETAEVEMVSPWAPLMWPFLSALALGLAVLTLQIAVEGLRAALGLRQPGRGFEIRT